MPPDYYGIATDKYIQIWNSAGTDTVAGIATASMSPVLYRDGVSANATNSMASVGNGLYRVTITAAENKSNHVDLRVLVSATAANGFASWDNDHSYVEYGSASAGTATTITLANTTRVSADDALNNSVIEVIDGSCAMQTRLITDYVTATRVATVAESWTGGEVPGTSTRYRIRRNVLTTQGFPSNFEALRIPADGRPEVNVIEVASASVSIDQFLNSQASISAAVDGALDAYNFSASVNKCLDNFNFSASIDKCLDNYNFSASIDRCLDNYNVFSSSNITEPSDAPEWGSGISQNTALGWLVALNLNRMTQSSTETELYTSAGAVLASASVNLTSSSANRDMWTG